MNIRNWLNELKEARVKKPMPILSFPGAALLGISVRELISSSENQAAAMAAIAQRTDAAASVSLMDLSLEAECFGCPIRVSDDEVPTVTGCIVSSMEEAQALKVPHIGAGRTDIYIEAIRLAKQKIKDRPVFAGTIGPFSLAGRLTDVTEAMIYCYDEPEMMHVVLSKATEFLIEYIKAYKKAGADGVVMAEPLAGLLSLELADEFSSQYVKRINEAVQDENFIVIYHNCGNTAIRIIDSILSTGSDAYHFGNAIDMAEMLEHIPDDVVAMGNVDPAGVLKNGTPESVRKATLDIMNACCKHRNFVISSGCDIPPATPWSNVEAFFHAAQEYYGK